MALSIARIGISPDAGSVARLARPEPAFWSLSLCPEAGEAGGCFVSARRVARAWVPAGSAADPERARVEAGRRARGQVRRYCAANRLDRFGTLTYRGDGLHDTRVLVEHVGAFFRDLRTSRGGAPFAYLWVPEWHKTHGLHVHFAVGQFIPRGLIDAAWGHGFVSIKRPGNNLPMGAGSWEYARRAAGYLSKYVTKAIDDDRRTIGRHRYEVAQGFAPRRVLLHGTSEAGVLADAVEVMGRRPVVSWSSREVEGWTGPPAMWFAWA